MCRRRVGSSSTVGRSDRLRAAAPDGVGEAWFGTGIAEGTEEGVVASRAAGAGREMG